MLTYAHVFVRRFNYERVPWQVVDDFNLKSNTGGNITVFDILQEQKIQTESDDSSSSIYDNFRGVIKN